jgi:hypothetical protein
MKQEQTPLAILTEFLLKALPTKWRNLIEESRKNPLQTPREEELCRTLEEVQTAHVAHREIGSRVIHTLLKTNDALQQTALRAITEFEKNNPRTKNWPDEFIQAATILPEESLPENLRSIVHIRKTWQHQEQQEILEFANINAADYIFENLNIPETIQAGEKSIEVRICGLCRNSGIINHRALKTLPGQENLPEQPCLCHNGNHLRMYLKKEGMTLQELQASKPETK